MVVKMYLTKTKPRRISILTLSALVALSSSVILFGGTAHAEEVIQPEETVKVDLFTSKPTLEQQSQLVFERFDEVQKEADKIEDIEKKKEFLTKEIEKLKEELKSIKKQVEEKKAREESERLQAIRAEEARRAESERQAAVLARQRAAQSRQVAQPTPARSYSLPRGSSAGNTYGYGYCTWYVKNMRPDIPNGLGNANTWFYRAQSMGLPTGTTPRVGAVGTSEAGSLGHVVIVRAVHGDGTITVSEMNYTGWNQVSSRTVSASKFRYIY